MTILFHNQQSSLPSLLHLLINQLYQCCLLFPRIIHLFSTQILLQEKYNWVFLCYAYYTGRHQLLPQKKTSTTHQTAVAEQLQAKCPTMTLKKKKFLKRIFFHQGPWDIVHLPDKIVLLPRAGFQISLTSQENRSCPLGERKLAEGEGQLYFVEMNVIVFSALNKPNGCRRGSEGSQVLRFLGKHWIGYRVATQVNDLP